MGRNVPTITGDGTCKEVIRHRQEGGKPMKIEIKKIKDENRFSVKMELTEDAILALNHALERYSTESAFANDIREFLAHAAKKANISL